MSFEWKPEDLAAMWENNLKSLLVLNNNPEAQAKAVTEMAKMINDYGKMGDQEGYDRGHKDGYFEGFKEGWDGAMVARLPPSTPSPYSVRRGRRK